MSFISFASNSSNLVLIIFLMKAISSLPSSGSFTRNARAKAPRSTARSAHVPCTQAPLPGNEPSGSGKIFPSLQMVLISPVGFSRFRQSTQLRTLVLCREVMTSRSLKFNLPNLTCQAVNPLNQKPTTAVSWVAALPDPCPQVHLNEYLCATR